MHIPSWNVYSTTHLLGKIESSEPESCGLRPCYLRVLPSSGSRLLELSRRDMLLLSRLPDWQQLTTPGGNRQGGALFLWLVGMRPLLLRHPPFRSNPLEYAQASKP